jgi:hypothetical protein
MKTAETIVFFSKPILMRRSAVLSRGVQKLMGENLKLLWVEFFNYKLGCFNDVRVFVYVDACPHL